ncbi:MAG: type II secretion system protein GspM [Betaproteobacteria bacterium]
MTGAVTTRSIALAPVTSWWAGKSRRERRVLVALGVFAFGALAWVTLWQPLVRDIARLEADRARSASEWATAQREVADITRLTRAPLPPPVEGRAALEQSLVRSGLRGALTQLDWQERRAHVVFASVSFPALVTWLDALQRDAGLLAVEATMSARVEPGTIRAELVLAP